MTLSFERRLGKEIAERRESLGFSQERLGYLCDLHRTYISEIERGVKSPTVRTLRVIAGALKTSAAELLASAEGGGR